MSASDFVVEVPGGRLIGWAAGEGTPALVLHGGPITDYTAPLADLLPSVRTIRYQQRGLPPSVVAPPYTIETHVSDALAVLDALNLERVWVIGHSWGGHLAMHLAVAHPERLLGLVLIDTLGAVPDGGWGDLDRNIVDRLARDSPEAAARAEELDRRVSAGDGSAGDQRESFGLIWPYYFGEPSTAPPMPALDLNSELSSGVYRSVQEHFSAGTLERLLPTYTGPFLLIHGEQDPLPPEASQKTAGLVPQATVALIANSGHFPWLEQPEAFLAVLHPFLRLSG